MTYSLNPEKKAFSYTREELFTTITNIVSHSSSAEVQQNFNATRGRYGI